MTKNCRTLLKLSCKGDILDLCFLHSIAIMHFELLVNISKHSDIRCVLSKDAHICPYTKPFSSLYNMSHSLLNTKVTLLMTMCSPYPSLAMHFCQGNKFSTMELEQKARNRQAITKRQGGKGLRNNILNLQAIFC